jgi:hypothetical protein
LRAIPYSLTPPNMATRASGTHAHFAEDTTLATVIPTVEPTTLPRPADLKQLATFQNDGLSSTQPVTPGILHDDLEKGLELESVKNAPASDIYDKYTKKQKSRITAIVSFASLLARESPAPLAGSVLVHGLFLAFASSSFLPSIPQLAIDMHTSRSTIDYTVCIYLVVLGIAYVHLPPPSPVAHDVVQATGLGTILQFMYVIRDSFLCQFAHFHQMADDPSTWFPSLYLLLVQLASRCRTPSVLSSLPGLSR